jgi:hypothetical protein
MRDGYDQFSLVHWHAEAPRRVMTRMWYYSTRRHAKRYYANFYLTEEDHAKPDGPRHVTTRPWVRPAE